MNIIEILQSREYNSGKSSIQKLQTFPSFIERLELQGKKLKGHDGCVNCLEWNNNGSILASASDDLCVFLWNPYMYV
jgi:WD and tetratricopeptide repeats protein 1